MKLKSFLILTLLSVLIFISSCSPQTTTPSGGAIPCDVIDLINALELANNTKEQVAINLAPGCIYDLASPYTGENARPMTALPPITSPIILHGNGATLLLTPLRDVLVRLFYISPLGSLRLNNIILDSRSVEIFIDQPQDEEGGMIVNDGVIEINQSTVYNGMADFGAAIKNRGVLNVSDSSFVNKLEDSVYYFISGGAIHNVGGDVTIDSTLFQDWEVDELGGAIYSDHVMNGSLSITDSEFTNNLSDENGGAIFAKGHLTITGSSFENNSAENTGGAIYHAHGNLTVSASNFSLNQAGQGGGVYFIGIADYHTGGTHYRLTRNDFILNSSTENGSAIYIKISDPESSNLIENNTISQNSGLSAVYIGGPSHVRYNTIAHNGGTGLKNEWRTVALLVEGNIIALNDRDCYFENNVQVLGSNLWSDGSCIGVTLLADPLLEPLANNGGPTLTHALRAGSPALDAASGDCPITDQRGLPRPGGSACDLGAFEVEDPALLGAEFGDVPELATTEEPALEMPPDLKICVARIVEIIPCKEGPGDGYDNLSYLKVEGIVEVLGQSLAGDHVQVRNPCFPELPCWVIKTSLVYTCDVEELPFVNAPPKDGGGTTPPIVCDPGASNQSACEAGGGMWTKPLSGGDWYCKCP